LAGASEQLADQLRPFPKTPRLGGTRCGEVYFDLHQHPRQHYREWKKRLVQIGGSQMLASASRQLADATVAHTLAIRV
jgi:hypothetical protein